jgi:two-component system chemotaxis response regulator CheB
MGNGSNTLQLAEATDTAGSSTAYDAIVIGGSSGAIEALMALLPGLPATLQCAVVIVLHLPKDRPSLLTSIFKPHCVLPLHEPIDKDAIAPGAVYFAPPDYHLLIESGPRIALSVDPPVHYSRPSIDVLFESAAHVYGCRLVGVLLSGANEDGAAGMQAIATAGGLAVVQSPASAAMRPMPESALRRAAVDHLLAPSDIALLIRDLHHQGLL